MPKMDKKEKLAQYLERAKEQGTLNEVLGKPVHRGRGRPRSPEPLRKITIRLDERTLFYIRLIGRELKLPWQRMVRGWLAEIATRELRNLRIQKGTYADDSSVSTVTSTVSDRRQVEAQEAERFREAMGGNIRNLLVSGKVAA